MAARGRLWRHVLGTPQSDDECLFHEADELFWLDIDKTYSGTKYVMTSG